MDIAKTLQHLRPGAEWALQGESYLGLDWFGPGSPPTLVELEAAWTALQNVNLRAFTMPELAAIWQSDDTLISALAMLIMAWPGAVHADHPEVVAGLDRLVTLNIISAERRAQIVAV